jgi:hypothetical protein
MRVTSTEVFERIDNTAYNEQGDTWWDENQFLHAQVADFLSLSRFTN